MSHVISNGFNESCLATGGVSCCDLWLAFSLTILGLEVWINIFAKKMFLLILLKTTIAMYLMRNIYELLCSMCMPVEFNWRSYIIVFPFVWLLI